MKEYKVTYENCKDCPYCNAENGPGDFFCGITNSQYETEDSIPCKQKQEGE